jgi:hypothetical protein
MLSAGDGGAGMSMNGDIDVVAVVPVFKFGDISCPLSPLAIILRVLSGLSLRSPAAAEEARLSLVTRMKEEELREERLRSYTTASVK